MVEPPLKKQRIDVDKDENEPFVLPLDLQITGVKDLDNIIKDYYGK